jgi:hypothetical protein
MRSKIIIASMVIISSCITQKKAESWMDRNELKAAGYCANKFPPDTITRLTFMEPDTSKYHNAVLGVLGFADSLINVIKSQRAEFVATVQHPCPPLIDLDSLRRVIYAEVKRAALPCKDSIRRIVNTVVDRAREKQLVGIIDHKDATITARDATVTELRADLKAAQKWKWIFWSIVAAVGIYVFLKLRFKLPF